MSEKSGREILTSFGRNSLFATASSVMGTVGGIAVSVLLARYLGPDPYGRYTYVMWLVGTMVLVASLGLPNTAIRYIAEYQTSSIGRARGLYVVLVKLASAAALVLAGSLIVWGVWQDISPALLGCAACLLVVTAIGRISISTAAGLQQYEFSTRGQVAYVLLHLVLLVLVLAADIGLVGLLLAILAAEVLRLLLVTRSLAAYWRGASGDLPSPGNRTESRRIFRFSASVYVLTVLDAVVWQKSEVFFLERYSTFSEVAVYSLSYGVVYMLMQFPISIANVLLPIFSQAQGLDKGEVLTRGYYCSTKYMALLIFPTCILAIVLAPWFIDLLYGADYAASVPVLRILLVGGAISVLCRPGSTVLYSSEKQHVFLVTAAVMAGLNILADFVLIPRYGAIGAGCANTMVQISSVSVTTAFLLIRMKYDFPWLELVKIAASAASASALIYIAAANIVHSSLQIFLWIVIFPILFGGGLRLFNPWDGQDERIFSIIVEKCPVRLRELAIGTKAYLGIGTSE